MPRACACATGNAGTYRNEIPRHRRGKDTNERTRMRLSVLALLGASALCAPFQLRAQDAGALPLPGEQAQQPQQSKPVTAAQEREAMQAELRDLEAAKRQFDTRIEALERRLGQVPPTDAASSGTDAAPAALAPAEPVP